MGKGRELLELRLQERANVHEPGPPLRVDAPERLVKVVILLAHLHHGINAPEGAHKRGHELGHGGVQGRDERRGVEARLGAAGGQRRAHEAFKGERVIVLRGRGHLGWRRRWGDIRRSPTAAVRRRGLRRCVTERARLLGAAGLNLTGDGGLEGDAVKQALAEALRVRVQHEHALQHHLALALHLRARVLAKLRKRATCHARFKPNLPENEL
mmetsp:Transcript_26796/g.83954  ORF Transcript_26796/g.83954 Transcript_26796/m.83954 type:complete len:212 (-) Transcript_26796:1675-2310(-)